MGPGTGVVDVEYVAVFFGGEFSRGTFGDVGSKRRIFAAKVAVRVGVFVNFCVLVKLGYGFCWEEVIHGTGEGWLTSVLMADMYVG